MYKIDPETEHASIVANLKWRKKFWEDKLEPKTFRQLLEEGFLDKVGWAVRGSRHFKANWQSNFRAAATVFFRNKATTEHNMATLIQKTKSDWAKKHERVERLNWGIRRIMDRSVALNEKKALFATARLLKAHDLKFQDDDKTPRKIVIVKTPDDYKAMKRDCSKYESSELVFATNQDAKGIGINSDRQEHVDTTIYRLVEAYDKFDMIDYVFTSAVAFTYSEANYYEVATARSVRAKPGIDLMRAGIYSLVMTYSTLYLIPYPIVKFDEQRRVHCPDGPSVIFMGFESHHWHGIPVPKKHVMNRKGITAAVIRREANTEVRRCLCEMVGWDKAIDMLKGKIIDEDECLGLPRTLYEIKFGTRIGMWGNEETDETARLLMMTNGTVEDGVRRKFIEVVDDECDTCHEAVAWQLGLASHIYNEGVRT